MKTILTFCIILSSMVCAAQTNTQKLIGSWELRTHIQSTGEACGPENKFVYTFYKDFTYTLIVNGYITSGKWKIEGDKILYTTSVLQNPTDGTIADHSYTFRFTSDGELIQKDYICSETMGTSYYRKK